MAAPIPGPNIPLANANPPQPQPAANEPSVKFNGGMVRFDSAANQFIATFDDNTQIAFKTLHGVQLDGNAILTMDKANEAMNEVLTILASNAEVVNTMGWYKALIIGQKYTLQTPDDSKVQLMNQSDQTVIAEANAKDKLGVDNPVGQSMIKKFKEASTKANTFVQKFMESAKNTKPPGPLAQQQITPPDSSSQKKAAADVKIDHTIPNEYSDKGIAKQNREYIGRYLTGCIIQNSGFNKIDTQQIKNCKGFLTQAKDSKSKLMKYRDSLLNVVKDPQKFSMANLSEYGSKIQKVEQEIARLNEDIAVYKEIAKRKPDHNAFVKAIAAHNNPAENTDPPKLSKEQATELQQFLSYYIDTTPPIPNLNEALTAVKTLANPPPVKPGGGFPPLSSNNLTTMKASIEQSTSYYKAKMAEVRKNFSTSLETHLGSKKLTPVEIFKLVYPILDKNAITEFKAFRDDLRLQKEALEKINSPEANALISTIHDIQIDLDRSGDLFFPDTYFSSDHSGFFDEMIKHSLRADPNKITNPEIYADNLAQFTTTFTDLAENQDYFISELRTRAAEMQPKEYVIPPRYSDKGAAKHNRELIGDYFTTMIGQSGSLNEKMSNDAKNTFKGFLAQAKASKEKLEYYKDRLIAVVTNREEFPNVSFEEFSTKIKQADQEIARLEEDIELYNEVAKSNPDLEVLVKAVAARNNSDINANPVQLTEDEANNLIQYLSSFSSAVPNMKEARAALQAVVKKYQPRPPNGPPPLSAATTLKTMNASIEQHAMVHLKTMSEIRQHFSANLEGLLGSQDLTLKELVYQLLPQLNQNALSEVNDFMEQLRNQLDELSTNNTADAVALKATLRQIITRFEDSGDEAFVNVVLARDGAAIINQTIEYAITPRNAIANPGIYANNLAKIVTENPDLTARKMRFIDMLRQNVQAQATPQPLTLPKGPQTVQSSPASVPSTPAHSLPQPQPPLSAAGLPQPFTIASQENEKNDKDSPLIFPEDYEAI